MTATRREFLRAIAGTFLLVAAPRLAPPSDDNPMGLLGLIDDSTYERWAYAKSTLDGATLSAMKTPGAVTRWLEFERVCLEQEATKQFGRAVRFEMIDEDGNGLRHDDGCDFRYVLWREVMA